jgi:hypothetical protein
VLLKGWRLAVSLLPLLEVSGQKAPNVFCPLIFLVPA